MHIYLVAVDCFLEKNNWNIHIPTRHYENILLPAFALEINVSSPFNLGFNLIAILIFTSLASLQLVYFFHRIHHFINRYGLLHLNIYLEKYNFQEKVIKYLAYLFPVLSFVPSTCIVNLRQFLKNCAMFLKHNLLLASSIQLYLHIKCGFKKWCFQINHNLNKHSSVLFVFAFVFNLDLASTSLSENSYLGN